MLTIRKIEMNKLLVVSVAMLFSTSVHAGLYRWIDDAGNVHFSDKVPAAISKKSHAKLSKQGGVSKQVDPASKIKARQKRENALKKEKQMAELEKVKAEAMAEVKKRNDDLLATYENENELVRYFESKIKKLEGNTRILQAQTKVLTKKAAKLEKKASKTKHKPTLDSINKRVDNIHLTLGQYKKAMQDNDVLLAELKEDYQTNLTRYQALTQ